MTKRILLVDDDKMVRDTFLLLLTQSGYSVDTAINGEDALKKLKDSAYDLVISNINMPMLNGIDFYHHIVRTYPYLSDKFILITGAIPADLNTLSALKNKIIEKTCLDEIMKRVKLLTMPVQYKRRRLIPERS